MFPVAVGNSSLMFLTGCGILIWVLLRRFHLGRGRAARRASPNYLEQLPRPVGAWDGAQKDSLALVERQKVELHELARDASGRIDSKLRLLDQLIAQNQRQIARMEELLAELETRPAPAGSSQ